MYCKVCGQDGPNDGVCCTYCGSPFDSKTIIANSSSEIIVEEDVKPISLSQTNKDLLPIRWILCGVSAILFVVMLCFPGFRRLVTRKFMPCTTLMQSVYSHTVEDIFSFAHPINTTSEDASAALEWSINIQNRESILLLMADALDVKSEDVRGLSDMQILCDTIYDQNFLSAFYGLSIGEQNILSLEQYLDLDLNRQWLLLPELSDQALLVDMPDDVDLSDYFNANNDTFAHIDPAVLEEVSIYYIKMLIDGFENINKSSEKVTCDGISQRVTVLKATISTRQLCKTLIDMLDDASCNSDVAFIIAEMENDLGQDYYEEFQLYLKQQKHQLQNVIAHLDKYSDFTLYTYLNAKNEIAGIKLEFSEDGTLYQVFSCRTVTKGTQFAVELILPNGIVLHGKGAVGQGISGDFFASDSQQLICQVILTDFVYRADEISGSVRLYPNEEIVEHLANQTGVYEAYLKAKRLPNFSAEIFLDWNNKNKNISISFFSNDDLLSCVYATVKEKELPLSNGLLEPGNYLDAEHWVSSLNESSVQALIDRLEYAGISSSFLQKNVKDNKDDE